MKEFLANYGLLIFMLVVCLGSHLFMHRGHGGKDDHHGHS